MSRSFTEREREIIRRGLIGACKECWSRYGYQKTGIRELTAIAGISPATFYHFFDSKEMLFLETSQDYEKGMEELFAKNMTKSPGKRGAAESVKAVVKFIEDSPWVTHMREDWSAIARRLPEDFLEKDFARDKTRIEGMAQKYGLKMKKPPELVTAVIDMIFMSATDRKFLPSGGGEAIDFIIDSVIENLFE